MSSAPLFIIGTERSGSNLLRLILNAHSAIAVPHPPHILKYFSPLEASYPELSRPEHLRKLVDDVLGLLKVHIYPWEMRPDPEKISATASPPNLLGIFFSIYDAYLAHSGKRRWGCKSTFMVHHIARVLHSCPQAKFILLVRDPRDVAVSSRKSLFSPFHPYFTAWLWRQQQLEGLHFHDTSGAGTCLLVKYEDLIEKPETTVRHICTFIEEQYEPAMLHFYQTRSAQKSAALSESWHNTGSPIQPTNQKKYRSGLRPAEVRLVERITGDLMKRLGYPLTQTLSPPANKACEAEPAAATLFLYWLQNLYWTVKVEIRALHHDKNYGLFWRRRLFLTRLRLRLLIRRFFLFLTGHTGAGNI